MSEISEKKIVQYQVCFDLPFLIFVKDNYVDTNLEEWRKAKINNQPPPYSPYVPRDNEPMTRAMGGLSVYFSKTETLAPPYKVKLENNEFVYLMFLKRINQTYPIKNVGEVLGDRAGRATFSSVIVNFNPELVTENVDIIELSIEAINKFIKHYKVTAQRFFIRPVTPSVIQSFNILTIYEDDSLFPQYMARSSGHLTGLGGSISTELDDDIRKKIITDDEPDIIEKIHLDIQDNFDLREYRIVAIESAVFFEAWLGKHLRQLYKSSAIPLSDIEIEDKFLKNDRYRTPKSITSQAATLIEDASGYKFQDTVEFTDWTDKAVNLRNNVVHGKKHIVSQLEAKESYQTVINAIDVIIKNTSS